jgi:guanine nucleotide-binding protein G(I)/G(S)/G(T) subunit beta-1
MPDLSLKIESAKTQISSLESQLNVERTKKRDATLYSNSSKAHLAEIRVPPATKVRRTLKCHFGKVTSLHWSGDSSCVASASQDGKLLLWNANTTNKLKSISLKSPYVMTVGMEQTKGNMVACGGLDNLVSIYKWNEPSQAIQELAHHDGFVSCVRFCKGESKILSSSGDSSLVLWDVETGRVLEQLQEHAADVMSISVQAHDENIVASGSVDKTVKIWDLRKPKGSTQSFTGFHQGDINGVDFLHDMVGTASQDGTCQLLDLRAHNTVGTLVGMDASDDQEGLTCCSFSKSGRILFAGHSNGTVAAWDVLASAQPAFVLQAHDKHVSSLAVNNMGDALCTSSWDTTLKIWA